MLNEEAEDMEDIYDTGSELTELNFEVVDPEAEPKSPQKEPSSLAAVRPAIPADRRDVLPGFVKRSSTSATAGQQSPRAGAAAPDQSATSGSTHTHSPAVEKVLLMRVSQPTFRHAFARPAPGFTEASSTATNAASGAGGSKRPQTLTPDERSRILGDAPRVSASGQQSSDLVAQLMSRAQKSNSSKTDARGDGDSAAGLQQLQANKPDAATPNVQSNRLRADRYEHFISAMRQRLSAVSSKPSTHASAASLAADVYVELRREEPELFEGLTEWEIEEEREELSRVYALRAAPMERVQSLVRARGSRFVSAGRLEDTIRELRSFHSASSTPADATASGSGKADALKAERESGWRIQLEWHPNGLLCKRFNVPNPYPDADLIGLPDPNVLRRFRVLGSGDEPSADARASETPSDQSSNMATTKAGPTPNIYIAAQPQPASNVPSSDPLSKLNEMLFAIRNEVSKSATAAPVSSSSSEPHLPVGPDRRHSRWDSPSTGRAAPTPSGFLEPKQPARAEPGAPVVNVTLKRQVRSIFDVLNDSQQQQQPQTQNQPRAAPQPEPTPKSPDTAEKLAESETESVAATAPDESQQPAGEAEDAAPKIPGGVDLFRAIFADSDDEDEDNAQQQAVTSAASDQPTNPKASESAPEPHSINADIPQSNAPSLPVVGTIDSVPAADASPSRLPETPLREQSQSLIPIASPTAATSALKKPTSTLSQTSGTSDTVESQPNTLNQATAGGAAARPPENDSKTQSGAPVAATRPEKPSVAALSPRNKTRQSEREERVAGGGTRSRPVAISSSSESDGEREQLERRTATAQTVIELSDSGDDEEVVLLEKRHRPHRRHHHHHHHRSNHSGHKHHRIK